MIIQDGLTGLIQGLKVVSGRDTVKISEIWDFQVTTLDSQIIVNIFSGTFRIKHRISVYH